MTQTMSSGTRRPRLGTHYWRLWWANAISSTGDGAFVAAHLLGRVNSVYRMLGWGLMPVGALAGGFVAHATGLQAPYIVVGLLCALSLLAAVPLLVASCQTAGAG